MIAWVIYSNVNYHQWDRNLAAHNLLDDLLIHLTQNIQLWLEHAPIILWAWLCFNYLLTVHGINSLLFERVMHFIGKSCMVQLLLFNWGLMIFFNHNSFLGKFLLGKTSIQNNCQYCNQKASSKNSSNGVQLPSKMLATLNYRIKMFRWHYGIYKHKTKCKIKNKLAL